MLPRALKQKIEKKQKKTSGSGGQDSYLISMLVCVHSHLKKNKKSPEYAQKMAISFAVFV